MANAPSAGISLPPRYRYEGPVAAGGMAVVYAAHDEVLDRPVAVKVLAEHLSEDDAARQRFQREARAAAALSSHPHVVTVFDVGEHEGRSFIVMELRRGGTLGDVLAKGDVPRAVALQWLREAAGALDAAHEHGVVHRDIKPANLLLDEHQRLAVADFGIARLAWEQQVTATGQVLGTAAYLSPEQAVGEPATAASDRYALAVVAFELLSGKRPFDAEHFAAQARAHIEDPPPPSGLGPDVDAVLHRGLAKDPADRWPSAAAFVDALGHALSAGARDNTTTTRFMGAGAVPRRTAPPPSRPAAAPARPGRPNRWLVPAIVAVLAAIAIVAAASGGPDGGRQAAAPTATPGAKTKKKQQPEAQATPTPAATATAAPTQAPAAATGDPGALNDQGFALMRRGDYAGAVPILEQAVNACGDSTSLTCAYATFNYGSSLNRSGNPGAAIPVLQRRLDRWPDNQPDTVRAELARACDAAGRDCGFGDEGGDGRGNGNGRAKGKKFKD
jgi:serine/threonine-protein kinase